MNKLSLVEMIFQGELKKVDLDFIKDFLESSLEVRLNSHENIDYRRYNDIKYLFLKEKYIDLVIITKKFSLCDFSDRNLFINIGLDNNQIELMLFLDLKDIISESLEEGINKFKNWAYQFFKDFLFEDMICKMDGGENLEYYFDKNGYGPLLKE